MFRSVLAVFVGYLAMAVCVIASMIPLARAFGMRMSTQPPAGPLPRGFLAANLGSGLVCALLGGLITAYLAPHSPFEHVLALAGFVLVMGLVSGLQHRGPAPKWYPFVIPLVGVAGCLIGGLIAARA